MDRHGKRRRQRIAAGARDGGRKTGLRFEDRPALQHDGHGQGADGLAVMQGVDGHVAGEFHAREVFKV